MREIEFRGLTKDGKWVYGNYSYLKHDDGREGHWIVEIEPTYVCTGPVFERGWTHLQYEVRPETVGEYTGLKDKNGTDLDWWKGDIVRDERRYINKREMIFQIVFSQGCFWLKSIHGKTCLTAESMTACLHDFTKIGNIHENPELQEARP